MTRALVRWLAVPSLVVGGVISTVSAQPGNYGAYFPGVNFASTAAEGFQNGRSNVIRSQGQFLLDSSQAASQFEDARAKNIQNRYAYTQAYFDLKKINKQQREELAGPRPTQEQLVRWAQAGAPKPLSESQLNPHDGELLWPTALATDDFAATRTVVDQLMARRSQVGSLNLSQMQTLQQTVDTMKASLKANIKAYPPNTYLTAKNFLESLAYQATQ